MEDQWNDTDREKPNVQENLSQCHFVDNQPLTWSALGSNPDLRRERSATHYLNHGTASLKNKVTKMLYKMSVRTSQKTQCRSCIKISINYV